MFFFAKKNVSNGVLSIENHICMFRYDTIKIVARRFFMGIIFYFFVCNIIDAKKLFGIVY
jgi:hypothetical protein